MRRHAKASFSAWRRAPRLSSALFFLLMGLALFSATAFASTGYTPTSEPHFGFAGSADGQLNAPRRIAVEQATGNIVVTDSGNDRIQVFAPSGANATYLAQFGGGVLDEPYGIAIDQSNGDIYVTDVGNERIVKFKTDGAPTPTYSQDGSFTSPSQGTGPGQIKDFQAPLALDPTNGDILVADPGLNQIDRYDASGSFLGSFNGSSAPGGAFKAILDLAVEPSGNIVAVDSDGGNIVGSKATGRAIEFGPSGAYVKTIESGATHDATVAIDPHNGNILLGHVTDSGSWEQFRGFTSAGASLGTIASRSIAGLTNLTGIAVDGGASARVYTAADIATELPDFPGIPSAGTIRLTTFEPVPYPDVSLDSAESPTPTTAIVHGTIEPHGFKTKWTVLGGAASGETGAVSGPVQISAELTGLDPNTQYTVRLSAHSPFADGTFSKEDPVSAPLSFTTDPVPPSAEALSAGKVGETSALLGGLINPRNSPTTYWFEYGADTNYGTSVPLSEDANGGSSLGTAMVTQSLSGLIPGTTYHYRVVAKNQAGTVEGNDMTVTTVDPNAPGPPDRGIELVNNPDKANQPILAGLTADGQKAVWQTATGAPGSPSGASGSFLASRTPSGWRSENLLPPIDQQLAGGKKVYYPQAFSADGSKTLFLVSGIFGVGGTDLATYDSRTGVHVALQHFSDDVRARLAVVGSPDLSHVYVGTGDALVTADTNGTLDIYDVGSGTPELVSLLPNGSVAACGVPDYLAGRGFTDEELPSGTKWISTDAEAEQTIFFESFGDDCSARRQLYARNQDAGTTTLISGPPLSGPAGEGRFLRASADGETVIFVSNAKLAADDLNSDRDIYRWQKGEGNTCLTCAVVEDAAVLGTRDVLVSKDLSHVYFLSAKQLVAGRGLGTGEQVAGLYLLSDGELSYVARFRIGANSAVSGVLGGKPSEYFDLTPHGDVLLFPDIANGVSAADPGTCETGTSQFETCAALYRYQAESGEVRCVSCALSPIPGLKGEEVTKLEATVADENFPGRSMTDDGSDVVFATYGALLPVDVNRDVDIYEWRNGKARLITDGVTEIPGGGHGSPPRGGVRLFAISPDGANVLFTVAHHLTGYELDHEPNLYVARADGGFSPPPAPPAPCVEDACQGPLEAPPTPQNLSSSDTSKPTNQHSATKKKHKKQKKRHHRKAKIRPSKQTKTSRGQHR